MRVVFPIRILARMGICSLVFTSAAAGINPAFTPGSLVLLSDHINLLGSNPMVGSVDERLGSRFADMSEVYNRRYREIARSSAENLGFSLLEGVFAGHTGPSYETPAEVRSLRNQGADLVGMSVVPEVIAARPWEFAFWQSAQSRISQLVWRCSRSRIMTCFRSDSSCRGD